MTATLWAVVVGAGLLAVALESWKWSFIDSLVNRLDHPLRRFDRSTECGYPPPTPPRGFIYKVFHVWGHPPRVSFLLAILVDLVLCVRSHGRMARLSRVAACS